MEAEHIGCSFCEDCGPDEDLEYEREIERRVRKIARDIDAWNSFRAGDR